MQMFKPAGGQDNETARIEAFSDGVLAIIITLLVFNMRVPAREVVDEIGLVEATLRNWPTFVAFTASFFFVIVMWINHHRIFSVIHRSDNNLMLLNGLLLFGISLVPFTSAVIAEYMVHPENMVAVMVYNGWSGVIALIFTFLWRYASTDNRLFDEHTDREMVAFITRQYTFGPLYYVAAMGITFFNPFLGLGANALLAVFFALPNSVMTKMAANAKQKRAVAKDGFEVGSD